MQTVLNRFLLLVFVILFGKFGSSQQTVTTFRWPDGKRAAISITFDDARTSQVDSGTALLDKYGIKATFFVVPPTVEDRLDGWKNGNGGREPVPRLDQAPFSGFEI